MSSKIVSSLTEESRRYWPPGATPSDNKPPDVEMARISHTVRCLHSYGTDLPSFTSLIAYLRLTLERSGSICCIRALRRMVAVTRYKRRCRLRYNLPRVAVIGFGNRVA